MPFVDIEGSILGTHIVLDRFRDHHVSNEGRIRSQPGLLNLVANRAGNSVCRGAVSLGKLLEWKTRKHLSLPARVAIHQMDRWHVTNRALILDGRLRLRMIDWLAPHAALPV